MPHFDMYKLLCYFHLLVCLHNNGCVMTEKASFLCSFDLHVTKTSPKYEQTEATYFFIITYSGEQNRLIIKNTVFLRIQYYEDIIIIYLF